MERRDLRHDRHTVSLLTDHIVFSPKYRGKSLVGDVALAVEGIIRKICKEMKIEISDMAVNVDHVHLFIEYPPKYSVSFIAKRMKGRCSRELREAFPSQGVVRQRSAGAILLPWLGWSWMGGVVERYIQNQEAPNAKLLYTGSVLKCGVGDFGKQIKLT